MCRRLLRRCRRRRSLDFCRWYQGFFVFGASSWLLHTSHGTLIRLHIQGQKHTRKRFQGPSSKVPEHLYVCYGMKLAVPFHSPPASPIPKNNKSTNGPVEPICGGYRNKGKVCCSIHAILARAAPAYHLTHICSSTAALPLFAHAGSHHKQASGNISPSWRRSYVRGRVSDHRAKSPAGSANWHNNAGTCGGIS